MVYSLELLRNYILNLFFQKTYYILEINFYKLHLRSSKLELY